MVIYHYVEKFGELSLPPIFYNIQDHEKYYPGEPVNIHIQLLINIILENNWIIITKKGKARLPLFCGNGERVIPIYSANASPVSQVTRCRNIHSYWIASTTAA